MYTKSYNIKKPTRPANVEIVTRAGVFNGLSFKISKQEDIAKTNFLLSVPNVSFSFDYTKVIFDYSQSKNTNDKNLIKALFANLESGQNFTISQGSFLLETDASSADISGTYSFVKLIGDSIIATPVSITSINNRLTIYENKHFTSIPQIGTTISPKNLFLRYTITNSLLSEKINSFINFGAYPNDFIKITGTNFNDNTYKILSVNKNSDGSETLIVEQEIKDEICFGTPILVELIQSGPYTYSKIEDVENSITGSCTLNLQDLTTVCFNNQTENQCNIRKEEKIATSSVWNKGGSCDVGVTRNPETRAIRQARRILNIESSIITAPRPVVPVSDVNIPVNVFD